MELAGTLKQYGFNQLEGMIFDHPDEGTTGL